MYLGRGITKISGGSWEFIQRATIEYDYKAITDSYKDINNNPQEDFLGYEITFKLTYVFKKGDENKQTDLRKLINTRNVTLYPRTDQIQFVYSCTLTLKEDKQEDVFDKMIVLAKVSDLQTEIPYI